MIRLIVFARYPVPGQVKTRLIPALGVAGAARLQHAMMLRTLEVARALQQQDEGIGVELRYTGGCEAQMVGLYGRDVGYVEQGEGDLGERMQRAAAEAFAGGDWPVLVGSDCPAMDVGVLRSACETLGRNDLVLGPATDGGYYLIGLRRPAPELFAGIAWSTATVLRDTLAAADGAGLRYELLQELSDVDEPADLVNVRGLLHEVAAYRPERIAVTGATGSLGLQFLRTALRRNPGVHVAALVRGGSAWPEEFRRLLASYGERIELVEGDLCELGPAARRAFGEAEDGVWHFAASTQLQCRDEAMRRQIWRTNVEGTRLLVDQCSQDVPLFHVSTAYVCGRRTGVICETELDGGSGFRNVYEESKFAAERVVRGALEGGQRGMVFRPSVVVSAHGGGRGLKVVDQLADALAIAIRRHAPRMVFRAEAGWGVNAVAGQWVVDRMLELAGGPAGRTYHLTAPEPVTLGQLREAAHELYPWFELELSPDADVWGLGRTVDRALAGYRDYLAAARDVLFDRVHTQLYARGAEEPALDVRSCLHSRVGATPRAGMPVPS